MGSGLLGGPLTGGPSNTGSTIAPAGQSAILAGPLGAGATDVVTKIGSTVADGTVNATAKLTSFRTGINGAEVEKLAILKTGQLVGDGGTMSSLGSTIMQLSETVWSVLRGGRGFFINQGGSGAVQMYTNVGTFTGVEVISDVQFAVANAFVAKVTTGGRFDQFGTDSTGTPGAATIDKATGKSSIAIGAASVTITNALCVAASRVMITPHARDATCKELIVVPGAGSFVVSGSANATAAVPFSWEVSNII